MATRRRNYRLEYQRRVRKAKSEGYSSYYHKRQTSKEAKHFVGPAKQHFVSFAKQHNRVDDRRLWYRGLRAIQRRDHQTADRIARRLGVRDSGTLGPPSRIFWYHE